MLWDAAKRRSRFYKWSGASVASSVWSREEVEAAVADYRRMLIQELSGQKYSKTEHRRALQKLRIGDGGS